MADETITAAGGTPPEVVATEAPVEAAPAAAPAEAKEVKAEVPAKFKDIVAAVEKMTVLELHELVKTLEGHWGVSAAAVAVVLKVDAVAA